MLELRTSVAEYYRELRVVLREHSSFAWLAQCRDCRIRFLTPRTNLNRMDMRCPTGCRARHEVVSSAERSGDYRKGALGREKKKALNRKRGLLCESSNRQNSDSLERMKSERLSAPLCYYRWLLQLLEGIRMTGPELKSFCEVIRTKVRQRGHEIGDKPRHIADD